MYWMRCLEDSSALKVTASDKMSKIAQILICQKDEKNWKNRENRSQIYDNFYISYGYNYRHLCRTARKNSQISKPSWTLILTESCTDGSDRGYGSALSWLAGGNPRAYPRHMGKSNTLFCDGHVEGIRSTNKASSGLYLESALGTKYTNNNRWTADAKPASGE